MRIKQALATTTLIGLAALAALAPAAVRAAEPIKVGLVVPMTGPFSYMGRQIGAGVNLYLAQNGNTVAGRKVEVILKDDTGVPDISRRLSQELVVNDKVVALAGYGLTPQAFSSATIATQSKTPMVVMNAATSAVTERSPYIVRVSMTLPQVTLGVAEWAYKNKVNKVVTLVSDFGPGIDAEKAFAQVLTANGGQVPLSLRMPMVTQDFSPFLQRVLDARPEAVFVFLPAGSQAAVFMRQFAERGLGKAGIRLIGPGDVTDDDVLGDMGDAALGVITSHHYSAAHPSAMNRKFVEAFGKANKGMRPNFMAVGGYDGMRVIMEGLKASKGAGGDALLNAMKGQIFESPRGQVLIDAQTRDIVQDVYIRKVERVDGKLYNVEFDVQKFVRDPGKTR